jgi:hypothetical protein
MFPAVPPLLWWPVIFFYLVQMPLCSFDYLKVVLLDVAFCQHQPVHVVSPVAGFEPSQFDWVSTDGVHSFDGLLG